ncbi:MAG: hypothetical protein PUB07_02085 [Clostridia bacterium]|nr:hypothetical protein [Clostridia bacterium]
MAIEDAARNIKILKENNFFLTKAYFSAIIFFADAGRGVRAV